jgi:hypothetical protein
VFSAHGGPIVRPFRPIAVPLPDPPLSDDGVRAGEPSRPVLGGVEQLSHCLQFTSSHSCADRGW